MALSNSVAKDEKMEEDWVVVKKRRIIIWVPPSTGDPQPRRPVSKSTKLKKIVNSSLDNPKKKGSRISSGIRSKTTATNNPKKGRHRISNSRSSNAIADKPKKRGRKISNSRSSKPATTAVENQLHVEDEFDQPSAEHSQRRNRHGQGHASDIPLLQQPLLDCELGDVNNVDCRREIMMHSRKISAIPRLPIGGSTVANRKFQARILERKLHLLGGLSNWLLSQGLDRFVLIFEREKLGTYQLVNLTMDKLKALGADAVGPRRKLIHAIQCLCKPYYFSDSQ